MKTPEGSITSIDEFRALCKADQWIELWLILDDPARSHSSFLQKYSFGAGTDPDCVYIKSKGGRWAQSYFKEYFWMSPAPGRWRLFQNYWYAYAYLQRLHDEERKQIA